MEYICIFWGFDYLCWDILVYEYRWEDDKWNCSRFLNRGREVLFINKVKR